MNKFSILLLSAAAFAWTGCSNEDVVSPVADGDGNVTLTVKLDNGVASRAFGDGFTALNLQYAVYEEGTTDPIITVLDGDANQVKFDADNLQTTVSLKLVNGKSYDIIFWADHEDAPYTFDAEAQTITIDYDNTSVAVNDEKRDAFYKFENIGKIVGPINRTITLKRPFAQINLGTNDLNEAEVKRVYGENCENLQTSMTTTAYSVLNIADGTVSDEKTITFTQGVIPTGETFNVKDHDLLQMNYILVPQNQSSLASVTYGIHIDNAAAHHTFDVTNVPVQANFRTNIYGAVLTNPVDFIVKKEPIFEEPDFFKSVSVATPEEFGEAITDPTVSELNIEKDLDLSDLTPEELTVDTPKTININDGTTITIQSTNPMNINSDLTVNGGDIDSEIEDLGQGVPANTFIVRDNGSLDLNNVSITGNLDHRWHGSAATGLNTAVVTYFNDTEINISNCSIVGSEYAVCGMGTANNSKVTITNTYMESKSASSDNGSNWAYATRLRGDVYIKDCTVVGIQGGLSIDGGATAVIDGGTYYTYSEPGKTAFYPLYVTGGATVTIKDGYFYGATKHAPYITGTSCVVGGDNDTNQALPNIIIEGGYFSGNPYNHVTKELYAPADGYKDIDLTIDGRKYIFQAGN